MSWRDFVVTILLVIFFFAYLLVLIPLFFESNILGAGHDCLGFEHFH